MAIVPANSGLFAILGQSNIEEIGKVLKEKYPDNHLALYQGQWLLVVPSVTTRELSESLGIMGDSAIGTAVVLSVTSYFGRANPQIWEWISSRLGTQRG